MGLAIAIWLLIGFVLMLMAGLTWRFAERHFNPGWMLLLGPLGIPAWVIAERIERWRKK